MNCPYTFGEIQIEENAEAVIGSVMVDDVKMSLGVSKQSAATREALVTWVQDMVQSNINGLKSGKYVLQDGTIRHNPGAEWSQVVSE